MKKSKGTGCFEAVERKEELLSDSVLSQRLDLFAPVNWI